jgi:uncharacterized protein (DUF1501 family)
MSKFSSRIGDFKTPLTRREWLTLSSLGVAGASMSGWLEQLAAAQAGNPTRRRSCILLWMSGGPSQMDTFDLKPGHANGGPYQEINTSVEGIRISQHLPQLARKMNQMAIIRSMTSREGDHGRATYLLRTGYLPQGAIQYPTLGSLVSRELGSEASPLPNFVAIAPYRRFNPAAFGPGFLGPRYAPLLVGDQVNLGGQQNQNYDETLRVEDLTLPGEVTNEQADARINILQQMEQEFVNQHPGVSAQSHQTAYTRAVRLMRTSASAAFNLTEENAATRDRYGRNLFGQGCLLARRLVERGVPFIEISLGGFNGNALGWDTHNQNFTNVQRLSEVLDPAWASLMDDLQTRGLLETTTIVWMGEFGRTPRINQQQGRDHYPNAWSTVLAGGGIRGGQVFGRTSADGTTVESERPTTVPDFLATVCRALGIDPTRQNMSNIGRPIRITDPAAQPIQEILA